MIQLPSMAKVKHKVLEETCLQCIMDGISILKRNCWINKFLLNLQLP